MVVALSLAATPTTGRITRRGLTSGPDPERIWLISDDPAHAWVRDTWTGQEIDARLPFPALKEGQH